MTNDRTSRTPESASESTAAATVWTAQRIRGLGAVTDLQTAAAIFGLSRTTAYELARTDQFPVPVLRFGGRRPYRFNDARGSASGRCELWMDAAQARAVRAAQARE